MILQLLGATSSQLGTQFDGEGIESTSGMTDCTASVAIKLAKREDI